MREIKDNTEKKVAKWDVEVLMTCFGLVMHDNHNFEGEEIMNDFQLIDDMFGQVLKDELDIDEMRKRLEDEVGIIVRS